MFAKVRSLGKSHKRELNLNISVTRELVLYYVSDVKRPKYKLPNTARYWTELCT